MMTCSWDVFNCHHQVDNYRRWMTLWCASSEKNFIINDDESRHALKLSLLYDFYFCESINEYSRKTHRSLDRDLIIVFVQSYCDQLSKHRSLCESYSHISHLFQQHFKFIVIILRDRDNDIDKLFVIFVVEFAFRRSTIIIFLNHQLVFDVLKFQYASDFVVFQDESFTRSMSQRLFLHSN